MSARQIKTGIYATSVNHYDRQVFDALVPLPQGTSYNSYVVLGSEKTALIDTAEPELQAEFFSNLASLKIEKIDYIISNHAEQDHSGAIPALLKMYPAAKVVTNPKCKELLKVMLGLQDDCFITVADRETLSLGDRTLEFIYIPWAHWPESMMTWVQEDKVLFPNDFLGSHLADSSLFVNDICKARDSAKRYYAQIMMPFRSNIAAHIKKVEALGPEIIAPSHGQVYQDPEFILELYKDWTSDTVQNEVVIPYVSMHGSTKIMVEYLMDKLIEGGIIVKPFNLDTADTGELAMALVDAATVVLGSPAVLMNAHPKAVYAAYLLNALKPKTRYLSIIGSYGWGSKLVDSTAAMLTNLKAEIIAPVVIKGAPDSEAFKKLDVLAEEIKLRHSKL